MPSALYIFEGPDGVGKTTLAYHLHAHFLERGLPSELLSFPGHEAGSLGEHIYRLYHDPHSFGLGKIIPSSEQLLFTAAHADVIENRILPALEKGTTVVLDRYWWSTWVHSTISNLDTRVRDLLIELELTLWRNTQPQCIFLVHRDRSGNSEHSPDKWQNLVSLYNQIRTRETNRVRIEDVYNIGELANSLHFVLDAIHK